MKKLLLPFAVFGLMIVAGSSQAQVRVGLHVNIGSQPAWGPAGYDYAEYYYLPDINVYYHIPQRQFVYLDRGRWIFAASLPQHYGHFDLYRGYKVVVNDPNPWLRNDYYRVHYASYRGYGKKQLVLRDAPRRAPVYVDRGRPAPRHPERDRRYCDNEPVRHQRRHH